MCIRSVFSGGFLRLRHCLKFALVSAVLGLVFPLVAQQAPNKPGDSVSTVTSSTKQVDGSNLTSDAGIDIGEPVHQVGSSIQPPVVIHMVTPKYSQEARAAKLSGNVVVSMIVDSEGKVRDVHVLRGVGMGLDENAMEAVKKYKFKPALKDGKPVAVYLNVQVNFKIVDRQ